MKPTTRLIALTLVAAGLLSGCGVDGAPKAPEAKPGVSVSGDARVGVAYTK